MVTCAQMKIFLQILTECSLAEHLTHKYDNGTGSSRVGHKIPRFHCDDGLGETCSFLKNLSQLLKFSKTNSLSGYQHITIRASKKSHQAVQDK